MSKRKILLFGLLMGLSLVLHGCGWIGGEEEPEAPREPRENAAEAAETPVESPVPGVSTVTLRYQLGRLGEPVTVNTVTGVTGQDRRYYVITPTLRVEGQVWKFETYLSADVYIKSNRRNPNLTFRYPPEDGEIIALYRLLK